jgi:hypothetical protein
VGPRAGLDTLEKTKIPFLYRDYKQMYRFSNLHSSHSTHYSLTAVGFSYWQGMSSFYGNIIFVTMNKKSITVPFTNQFILQVHSAYLGLGRKYAKEIFITVI